MAAINFEALTTLGGEFLEFNELGDYTSIVVNESNIGGGFHLEARGSGDQLWCSYDSNEFYLKLGRISMMDKGDEFLIGHNNFYGYDEEIFVLEKEAPGKPEELVEIIVSWTHYYDFSYKNEKEFGSIEKYISIRIPQRLIEEYQKWYSFRKMWNILEEEAEYLEPITDWEGIEAGDIEPIIDEEEYIQEEYEFPPCESSFCLGCGDEKCPYRKDDLVWDKEPETKPYICKYYGCDGCGKCEF